MKARKARIKRKTRETDILVDINLDGSGQSSVNTGIPFMDHMLELLAKHSLVDIKIKATGDLKVDYHHTVEDLGLAFGQAVDQALGTRKGICRYGSSYVPMDEALALAVVDLGGRPFFVKEIACRKKRILDFELSLIDEFFQALVVQARMNLHIKQLYGNEAHHAYEAVFKAFARALRQACELDPRNRGIPSSKGKI